MKYKTDNGELVEVRPETYICGEDVADEILDMAKSTSDNGNVKWAYYFAISKKELEIETVTMIKTKLITVFWNDDVYFKVNGPCYRFNHVRLDRI